MPKNLPIHLALARKIKGLYAKNKMGLSLIGNPIESFKGLKKGAKMRGKKHATRSALGTMTRARIVNGPEVNVLLLGIPFLIDFGVSYGQGKFRKGPPVPKARAEGKEPVRLRVKEKSEVVGELPDESVDSGSMPPLPPAPFSDQALVLRHALLQSGMSEAGARFIASGEAEGEELADYLDEEDMRVLVDGIGTLFVPEMDGGLPPLSCKSGKDRIGLRERAFQDQVIQAMG